MNITYVGPVPPLRGGISQHGGRLVEALRSSGHRVRVCSWAAQYPRRLFPGEQWDRQARPLEGANFSLRWWIPASWWRAGRAAAKSDLLVFPWVTPLQAPAYRLVLAAASSVPAVAIVHNPVPHERRPFDDLLTRWTLRKVRGAVVHALVLRDQLHELIPNLEVATVPMASHLHVEPTDLPLGPPYRLLFFGFVRPYKGLDVALDALSMLVRRGAQVELTVAGEFWGPVEPWRAAVRERGLTGRVDLRAGYVPDSEVGSLMAAHHAIVVPYRTATQSSVVALAYAAGRPVAATTAGGLAELVTEGVNGALSPPGDPAALADAIERVLADLPRLARGARSSTPSWSRIAAAVVGVVS